MTLMAFVGLALTRMLINDSRFVSKVEAMMNARQAARAAMNTMGVELRMVSDEGLVAADSTDITVRAPYAFGLLCAMASATERMVVTIPTDSLMYASASADGIAWQDNYGNYATMTLTSIADGNPATELTHCTTEGITVPTGGNLYKLVVTSDTMAVGSVFYFYQTLRYRFTSSIDVPGSIGLFRTLGSGTEEEILAPFDASARFAFFVGSSDTASTVPPADLSTVSGLELWLVGESELVPEGETEPETFSLRTRIDFLNVENR